MREELLIPVFLRKALTGETLTIAGKGDQFRKFVYVTDLARAHLLAMNVRAENQTYNLDGARRVTVLEVAEGIRRLVGDQVRIEFTPERPGDFGGKEVIAEKARDELAWEPTIEFEEGLRRTVDWFRERWGK
jgi:UDP-glucose 4-epimerase